MIKLSKQPRVLALHPGQLGKVPDGRAWWRYITVSGGRVSASNLVGRWTWCGDPALR